MTVWKAGMLVVCVDASKTHSANTSAALLKIGNLYRVHGVAPWGSLWLDGLTSNDPRGTFAAFRFRPLIDQADDTALIARIKACKQKEKVG